MRAFALLRSAPFLFPIIMASICHVDPPEDELPVSQNQSIAPHVVHTNHVEYDFVEQPSQDFFCPVTLELLINPHQTTCCGNHLSQEAVNRLQRDGKPCPMCKEAQMNTVPDKFYKRRVSEIKVRCPYKKSGCEWVGEVGSLQQHSQSCPKRPWQCQYCDLATTYDIGPNEHIPKCTKYPEPCPNSCEIGTVPRCDLEKHKMVCPLEIVSCGYADVGCDVKVCRRDLSRHMEEGQQQHLLSATLLNLRLTRENMKEKDQVIAEKNQALIQHEQYLAKKDLQIRQLQKNVDELRKRLISVESKASSLQQQISTGTSGDEQQKVCLEYVEMCYDRLSQGFYGHELVLRNYSGFQRNSGSIAARCDFYSHPGGLKLSLSVDYGNLHLYNCCFGDLCLSVYVSCCPRELCSSNPLSVTACVQLLNQSGDHNHREVTVTAQRIYAGRNMKMLYDTDARTPHSQHNCYTCNQGFRLDVSQLMKLSELQPNLDNNIQYVMCDSFRFRVYLNISPIHWVHNRDEDSKCCLQFVYDK